MKLLYISTVCTPKVLDYIFKSSIIKPSQAVQKFHRLLIEGFAEFVDLCQVEVLTSLPVSPGGHKRIIWNLNEDKIRGIPFHYIPFLNIPLLKHIIVFSLAFFKVIFWRFTNRKEKSIVICDILNVSIVWATFFACKLTRQSIAVIVTDLPVFMDIDVSKYSIIKKHYLKITTYITHRFDYYIGLTEQMNKVVNPFGKPFLVMEGLVDGNIVSKQNVLALKNEKRIFLYAGGLCEKYGIKMLIEAFMLLKQNDIELHIYGSGDFESEMTTYCNLDKRILYFGVVSNSIVVKRLEEAFLLINPRPTTEEYTKFSFPSKNMEYMVSGTPLLTTKLPGMPSEYNDFVYLIEDESVEGIYNSLYHLLFKTDIEIKNFGKMAQNFVLKNKSNEIQAKRIIDFLMK